MCLSISIGRERAKVLVLNLKQHSSTHVYDDDNYSFYICMGARMILEELALLSLHTLN